MEPELRFIPSRVDGLTDVTEVAIFPDRIELATRTQKITHRFADIARWPAPAALHRLLFRTGIRRRRQWLPVADRDWFHEPPDMFFRFYTRPRLTIYMPTDEVKDPYDASHFSRIQNIIRSGGFSTNDLG